MAQVDSENTTPMPVARQVAEGLSELETPYTASATGLCRPYACEFGRDVG
jgi:hypothetical protein